MKEKELLLLANDLRKDVVQMLTLAQSGHTAGALGMAEVFSVLYFDHVHVDPARPDAAERDYVFVSNGHICAIWYAALAKKGFFHRDNLWSFRKINSLLQGHPHNTSTPGVENSGGPLGQGVSQACGAAISLKRDGKKNRVYCIVGDGEHDEGECWEAAMFAGNYQLDNLCIIMDRNHIQIDNYTEKVMQLEPLADKFRAFNWNVLEVNGHDVKEIKKALQKARKTHGKPTIIIAQTTPGKGVREFESKYEWHGKPPNEKQAERAFKDLEDERERIMQKGWFS